MSVDQTCEDIVRVVNLSKLDYQMNQHAFLHTQEVFEGAQPKPIHFFRDDKGS